MINKREKALTFLLINWVKSHLLYSNQNVKKVYTYYVFILIVSCNPTLFKLMIFVYLFEPIRKG